MPNLKRTAVNKTGSTVWAGILTALVLLAMAVPVAAFDVTIDATDPDGNPLAASRLALASIAVGLASPVSSDFQDYGLTVSGFSGVNLVLVPGILKALPDVNSKVPGGQVFLLIKPKPNVTISVNTRGASLQETSSPGESRIEIRYNFVDLEFVPSDLSGNPVSGPEFGQALRVTAISPAPAGFTPDSALGPYRTIDNLFMPDNGTGINVNFQTGFNGGSAASQGQKVYANKTYYKLGAGGIPPGPTDSPGLTRIQVRYNVLSVQIAVTDQTGNALAPDRVSLPRIAVGQAGTPSTNFVPYGGTVLIPTGQDLVLTPGLLSALPGTYAKVPAGNDFILVSPRPDTTISVNTRNGNVTKTRTVGVSKIEIRYNFADVVMESADLSGSAVSGSEFNKALKMTGISPAPPGFSADSVFGAYRVLDNLFIPDKGQGVDLTFAAGLLDGQLSSHNVKVFRENTYHRLASGGAGSPASTASPGATKVQVR